MKSVLLGCTVVLAFLVGCESNAGGVFQGSCHHQAELSGL